jgi:hypothetical protein
VPPGGLYWRYTSNQSRPTNPALGAYKNASRMAWLGRRRENSLSGTNKYRRSERPRDGTGMTSDGQARVLESPRAPLSSRPGSGPPVRSPVEWPEGAARGSGARRARPTVTTGPRSGRRRRRAPTRPKGMVTTRNSDGNEIVNRRRTVPNEGGRLAISSPGEGRPLTLSQTASHRARLHIGCGLPSPSLLGSPPLLTLPERMSRRRAPPSPK